MMPPPPRTGEKGEVAAPDRKRAWVKPSIRKLTMVATRTGTEVGFDEDSLLAIPGALPHHKSRYAPQS